MSNKKQITTIKDEQLEKVSGGGQWAFNNNQCPCGNFQPYDGNANNTATSNCTYYVLMREASCDACSPNGVCKNYK